MPMFNVGHVALNWREDGDPDGKPLVFANSLGTDLRLWDSVLPRLPEGFRVIRYDKRGHGQSSIPPAPYSMEELAADAAALLDDLGISDAIFVGLSIGGMIGQALAASRPDLVKALVLSNTAAKMGEPAMWQSRIEAVEAGGIDSVADAILDRWFAEPFRSGPECRPWRDMLAQTPAEGYLGCCHAIMNADLSAQTAALTLPTLAIAGSEDGASPAELVRQTADLIAGSRYEVVEMAGHLPCVERPAAYTKKLYPFLVEQRDV